MGVVVIWNLDTQEFIYEFMKHMNSNMKKLHEFIGYIYIYIYNDHMNS